MMPIVAVCVYCSQKIEEKEKSVDVPHLGGVAHLACAQMVAIRTAPFRRIPVSMGRSPVEPSGPLRPEGCSLQSDAEALAHYAANPVRTTKRFLDVLGCREDGAKRFEWPYDRRDGGEDVLVFKSRHG